jgi:curved DNA-binding protein
MPDGQNFVDYYDVLQVSPNCDAHALETAYRHLVKRHHPDHSKTADVSKFTELTEAFRFLRDSEKRADYDRFYFIRTGRKNEPNEHAGLEVDEKTAVSDSEVHDRILLNLYKKRREHASDPGILGWSLQEMLGCSDDSFEFHSWYLKSKGFIELTEQGTLAITIQGVDHVISTSRSSLSEKLLIAQSEGPQG